MIARISFWALSALLASTGLNAAIIVPGANGSDGVLNITTSTEIDLSQAVTAAWDSNNAANAGKGVYDATQWAVVFKYSSVNIAAGATVTFKNHASRAPVVWLVSGDVVVAGIVSVDGKRGADFPNVAEPGPGGFRGGMVFWDSVGYGSGFGPGGGQRGDWGAGGSYGTKGGQNGPAPSDPYGNPSLIPLLGGSGGGAYYNRSAGDPGGGAGGGAMLIAATSTIRVNGTIRASGGAGRTGGGSGGGIRLVSSSLEGAGTLSAIGGTGSTVGGLGRIRLERFANNTTIAPTPSPSIVQLTDGATALLWPPSTAPKVEVVSIGGNAAPADPRASFGTDNPDVVVAEAATTTVIIRTTNAEQASQVKVRGTPRTNGNYTEVNATVSQVVTTSPLVILWTATLPVLPGHTSVIARVIRP